MRVLLAFNLQFRVNKMLELAHDFFGSNLIRAERDRNEAEKERTPMVAKKATKRKVKKAPARAAAKKPAARKTARKAVKTVRKTARKAARKPAKKARKAA